MQHTVNESALAKRPEEKAFEKDIRDHQLLIYKICRIYADGQSDRDDLYQEIVIQLWKSYPSFRGESKFSTWLYRLAINTALTGVRRKKMYIESFAPEKLPVLAEETESNAEEQSQQLNKAISELNQIEKAIVLLYLEERSYEEMEEILGISSGTLRVKMSRIKDKLRQITKRN